jgi:hypothetical protein
MLFAVAFFGGLAWLIGHLFDVGWLRITAYVIAGIGVPLGGFTALTARVAACPYCDVQQGRGAYDGLSSSDHNEQKECGHCFEWLVSHEGKLRAFTDEDAAGKARFDAPAFEQGVWPPGCAVCGGAADRVEEARKVKVELSQLLVGTLAVASGSIRNVPSCAEHSGGITVDIRDDYLRVNFPSYAARRRYVAANRGAAVVKIR